MDNDDEDEEVLDSTGFNNEGNFQGIETRFHICLSSPSRHGDKITFFKEDESTVMHMALLTWTIVFSEGL